ncbi:cytochrome P450 [Lentinula boryana]|uniref:Cytochrome P450 n=1 Tax=Lentinula boryana TaxID=40481 RepID=A0ABQ8PXB1_9AGAR|nr:cytochrome P450 [Lentinula boryana]
MCDQSSELPKFSSVVVRCLTRPSGAHGRFILDQEKKISKYQNFLNYHSIDDLFKVYGPVVRIAPTTVAFLDPDYEQQTTRMVYTALKLDKGPIYNAVQMYMPASLKTRDTLTMVNSQYRVAIIEHNVHAKYKCIFSSHYSPGNIALLHPDMKVSVELLIQKILEAKGQPVDIFHGMHLVMIDLILKSTFGHDQGALEVWSEHSHDIIIDIPQQGIVPKWLFSLVRRFPNKRWQTFCSSSDTLFDTMADFVREQQKEKDEGRLDERDNSTLIERLFAHNDSCAPGDQLSFEDMTSESTTHLLAGVDASAVAVSYILWRFANQPLGIKQQIQAELDDAIPDAGVLPNWKTLHNLPILDALFKEGLCLYGPIPTFLERLAPRGVPLNLLGYQLPPGTVIGTQSWSMHQNARIFGNPEEFDISRWLDNTNQLQDAMSQAWAPYRLGTRICIGQHLARGAMKTVLAALLRNFDVLPCPETNDETMDMMELFGMFPVGLSCKLKFHPHT